MIRVTHINSDPGLGGITRWLHVIMRQLAPAFAQTLLILDPKQGWPPHLAADIIVLHAPPSWRGLLWRLMLRLRNWRAKIIAVEHSYTGAFEALHVRHQRRFRLLLRLSFLLADQVVAVSAGQGEWLRRVAGIPARRLSVINPFTDLAALRALPAPRREGGLRLCGYGRFCPQKGFDLLIEAMRLVPPELASLRLVGLGPEEDALRAQAAGLAHVSIEGPVPGPEALLGTVDAVVLPSRFEAFGIVAAEARAAARPVILAAVDGLASQALPNAPELAVPAGDVPALAAAIIWLAGQDVAALGLAGRRAVAGAEMASANAWAQLLLGLATA